MNERAMILTYHAVERGPEPLCLDPSLFREHLDVISDSGARTLTVSELASCLRERRLPKRAVVITFDDGFASVVEEAVPALLERGMKATIYCVAGYLGRLNEWPTQRRSAPRRELASAAALAELAGRGVEIGSHGVEHAPLDRVPAALAERELRESRELLADAVGTPVKSFAYPYGGLPRDGALQRVRELYSAACAGGLDVAGPGSDPFALPRVDAYYLRRPALMRKAVAGSLQPYLRARRIGARARRLLVSDSAAAQM